MDPSLQPINYRVQLTRPHTGISWGFRLQGGKDFTTPLSIQLVQPGSIAENVGLEAGDGVLRINDKNADLMDHEEAKMEIVRSGNQVDFLVQRGAVRIWKPQVKTLSELRPDELQTHTLPGEAPPIQKTSLAHEHAIMPSKIGAAHNRAAKPFPGAGRQGYQTTPATVQPQSQAQTVQYQHQPYQGQQQGATASASGSGQSGSDGGALHMQYNTPIGIYAADNIADTFVQQTSALQQQISDIDVNDGQSLTSARSASPPAPPPPPASAFLATADLGGQMSHTGDHYSVVLPPPPPPINQNGNIVVVGSQSANNQQSSMENHKNIQSNMQTPCPNNNNDIPKVSPTMLLVQEELLAQQRGEGQTAEDNVYRGDTENKQSRSFRLLKQDLDSGGSGENIRVSGVRSVRAPQTQTGPSSAMRDGAGATNNTCAACNMLVTGVFVKVRGRPLHADCFRCDSCRKSLKNQGYFWINEKIYCEEHAKKLTQPDDPDLVPVPVYH